METSTSSGDHPGLSKSEVRVFVKDWMLSVFGETPMVPHDVQSPVSRWNMALGVPHVLST